MEYRSRDLYLPRKDLCVLGFVFSLPLQPELKNAKISAINTSILQASVPVQNFRINEEHL